MQKKSYSIVGTNHTGKEAFVNGLKTGTAVVLVREPRNQYDPMAIAVYIGGERVGYIPKRQNQVLAYFHRRHRPAVGAAGVGAGRRDDGQAGPLG